MRRFDEVLGYWLKELGPAGWYVAADGVDQTIRQRFMPLWEVAWEGGLTDWPNDAEGALAYLVVTDQFPRNMFRGDARSFATDEIARHAARAAIARGLDLQVNEPERVFFYMPFEHSEDPADQHWAVELMQARILDKDFHHHARVHREVIRRFGRFPFRNDALGRISTPAEEAFLAAGGYGSIVRELAG